MKIEAVSIRPGNVIEHKKRLWVVAKTQHTQPGKGGAYMQVEMKDVRDGTKLNERFRSAESVEKVRLDEKQYQFLYLEGNTLHLMDNETYEQTAVDGEMLGEGIKFLTEGINVTMQSYEGEAISVMLPDTVTAEIDETEPVVKGQTAASSNKPALLTNGVRIMVPPFIEPGDKVIIKTADFSYMERAK